MVESQDKLIKKWVKIYPIYLDKAMKLSEGRKVGMNNSVLNPTARDIQTVCSQFLNLNCKIEDHSHPKDWMKKGRVIVELKNTEGNLMSKEILKKQQLVNVIGATLVKHKETESAPVIEEKKKRRNKKK